MTSVANKYHFKDFKQHVVTCMRPYKYGNPFVIGVNGNRAEVIAKFKAYWYATEQTKLRCDAKIELQNCVLLCCCKPLDCHCDIIADFVNARSKATEPN